MISFTTLIRIASANRLAAANPLAPRHRHGHFDSSFQILHPSYVSPTYSEKVSRLTFGTNVAFGQLRKFDAGTTTIKEMTLVVSFCAKKFRTFGNFRKVGVFSPTDFNFSDRLRMAFLLHMHELNTKSDSLCLL